MRKGLLLICVLFLATRCVLPASAAEEGGSIRLSLPGGNLYLYPVAEIRTTDDEETYIPGPEFADFRGSLADLSSPSLAEELAGYALEHSCFCLPAEVAKDGSILFSDLKPGLYLLVQTEAAPGYEKMAPFLIYLPDGENEPVHMDANPKFQLTPLPTQPLPSLPQTGQINWPIPILCSSGILLFLIGLFLQRRRHG